MLSAELTWLGNQAQTQLCKTVEKVGFDLTIFSQYANRIESSSNNDDAIVIEKHSLDEFDKVLKRVRINDVIISVADFVASLIVSHYNV